ncbi:MAG: ferritin family protein [Proteobacteria bacterium]|nr:ferritin family protein [Pseudomonadota bacterium]MBU1685794.1 ferritin family protein [Pseudomonadota bacterium]
MAKDKDGESYYRELAGNCRIEGIKTILTMLANEEVKHFNILVQMQKQAGNIPLGETTILENVKNVFIGMKGDKANFCFDSSDIDAYRKAMAIEEMSLKFYQDKAAVTEDQEEKQIFLSLASEERKHFRIMENIVEFVVRPEPGNWLENAEWYHLDEY